MDKQMRNGVIWQNLMRCTPTHEAPDRDTVTIYGGFSCHKPDLRVWPSEGDTDKRANRQICVWKLMHACLCVYVYLYADDVNRFPCWITRGSVVECSHNLCSVPGADGTTRDGEETFLLKWLNPPKNHWLPSSEWHNIYYNIYIFSY